MQSLRCKFARGGLARFRTHLRQKAWKSAVIFCLALSSSMMAAAPAAQALVSLSGDPYVHPEPYHAPAIPHLRTEPLGGASPNYRAPYNPPEVNYQPKRAVNPSLAPNHYLWCRQNHPSYRAADNTYRPMDKGGHLLGAARVQCVSP